MNYKPIQAAALIAVALGIVAGTTLAGDTSKLRVPDGLSFSDFEGYQDWRVISMSQTDDVMAVIVANSVMMEAYRAGIPGNGKPFPDGSKMAKIHWKPSKSSDAPSPTVVPGTLHDVDFMVRDNERFGATGGWGYAEFDYDEASDTFSPLGSGAGCGYACHTIVKGKDYIFTGYSKR